MRHILVRRYGNRGRLRDVLWDRIDRRDGNGGRLRGILRDGEPGKEERIREKIREAVKAKPAAHCFEHKAGITEHREMVRIGG